MSGVKGFRDSMKNAARLETALDGLSQASSLEKLGSEIRSLRDLFQIEHLVYHSVNASGGQYAALTYSDAWVERYLSEDYARIDPVVTGCFQRYMPVDWKALDWSSKSARALLGEAVDAGLGNQGFTVPVHGPMGQFALFTVNDRSADDAWARFTGESLNDLILVAHYTNERALDIEGREAQSKLRPLSPRERDALTLLALGQSRAQAADHLAISEHTLRAYIESARLKLGASNTTHAVARALTQGLVVL